MSHLTIEITSTQITAMRMEGETALQVLSATGDGRGRLIDTLFQRLNEQLGRVVDPNQTAVLHTMDLWPHGGLWLTNPGQRTVAGLWVVAPWTREVRLADGATVVEGRTVPLPRLLRTCSASLLMGCKWVGGVPQRFYLWAVNTLPIASGVEIRYRAWPCGNVYESGKICWGQLQAGLARLAPQPANFRNLEDAFFYSEFNRDLVYGGWAVSPDTQHLTIALDAYVTGTPLTLAQHIMEN